MMIWVDDIRPCPDGYVWVKSVNAAILCIKNYEIEYAIGRGSKIELIDIDHDAGEYANEGGDYIKLLDWLEETGRNYPIRVHSMNPVGRGNMQRIIKRNGWMEVM